MVLTRAFACALTGRGIGHSRLPRGAHARGGRRSGARRPGRRSRTRSARSWPTSRGARRWARPRARSPSSGTRGRRSRARLEQVYASVTGIARRGGAGSVTTARRVWRSGWAQAARRRRSRSCSRSSLIWWRGPDWGSVFDAFRLVIWSWIVLAFALNVVSTLFRALSWRLTDRAGAAAGASAAARSTSSRRSASACSRTRSCRGRLGELARVATLRRHLPDAPPGTSATLIGTVFAHRLFDLVPGDDPRRVGAPHRGGAALGGRRRSGSPPLVGFALFTVAWLGAQASRAAGHERGHGLGPPARRAWGGRGSSVLKAPVPLAGAILLQCLRLADAAARGVRGDAGVRHRRAASGGRARARADEHRDDRPALAGKRRPRPGRRRAAAPELRRAVCRSASPTGSRCRRSRSPAGSRSGCIAHRARGHLVRGAPAHGGGGAVRRGCARGGARDGRGARARASRGGP